MIKLPFPEKILESHIAIMAKTGAGKSYLCQGIAEHVLAKGERICLVDPTDRYWGLRMGPRGGQSSLDITIFGGVRGDVALQPNHGKALAEIVGKSSTSTIISTRSLSKDGRAQFAADFFERLLACNEGILHLVIDEAHLFAPQQGLKASGFTPRMLGATNEICSSGRGVGLRIIMISQRAAKLHNDCLSCAETLIAMRMLLPADVEAVQNWIKHWASLEQARDLLKALPRLPTGEAYLWAPEQDILKVIEVPQINTYDSGAPGAATSAPLLKPLDMDAIQAKLSKAGEAVLSEDPRALKAEIAKLRADLARAHKLAPVQNVITGASKADLDAAHGLGLLEGEAKMRERALELFALLEKLLGEKVALWIGSLFTDTTARMRAYEMQHDRKAEGARAAFERAKGKVQLQHRVLNDGVAPPPLTVERVVMGSGAGAKLSKAERKVLIALAQYPEGRTKAQVAVLAGYAVGGGGFNNAVSANRSAGRLDGTDPLRITEQGLADLGAFEPLPTGRALLDHWIPQLSKAEREILTVLVDHHPEYMTKPNIAEKTPTGYEPDGGGFNNALSRLRTLELLTRDQNGIRASDNLF